MHAYLITAKPGPFRRALTGVGRWTVRLLALAVMAGLGLVALIFRCIRPVANYLAMNALWLELWAANRTGLPPVSSIVGSGLTDQFVNEFHRARTGAATN